MTSSIFDAPPEDKNELERGLRLTPRFDANGLVTAVVTDATDGQLLMVGHMNSEALQLTIETGIAHYWSRSRGRIWKKGETSGNVQHIEQMRVDCDQDALWLKVRVGGSSATCHTGRRSCFYRVVNNGENGVSLIDDGGHALFDPARVYRDSD